MENIFKAKEQPTNFKWSDLGDIQIGRGNLGDDVPVIVYRLMQFTMKDILTKAYGQDKANQYFRDAGHIAGVEFARNVLDTSVAFDDFVANLQKSLYDLKIGILRIESVDENAQEIILSVGEDLDCSGLPITNETVCYYDEGFIAGILEVYTGKPYKVREIDCWASGDRTCRFKCTQES